MSALKWINIGLRGVMEAGIVLAFAYWGYHTGQTTPVKLLLCIATPVAGFGFWGLVDFHGAGQKGEWLRLIQELVISGLAAVAIYAAGQLVAGWILGSLSIIHHALVYLLGERLLKQKKR